MEEELEVLWKKLQLTEEEEESIVVPEEVFLENAQWLPNCLLGKLLTRKSYNKDAFKSTMARIWKATPIKKIVEVGENLFLFQFNSSDEREVVINGGPWNFDDKLVLIKALEKGDKPGAELLTKVRFWVQVYGLPFISMSETMGRLIGDKFGIVFEVKTDEEGMGFGRCLAVRVELDIRKPIIRRRKITVEGKEKKEEVWVDLKYERLPIFCFCCGFLDHSDKECVLAMKEKKASPNKP